VTDGQRAPEDRHRQEPQQAGSGIRERWKEQAMQLPGQQLPDASQNDERDRTEQDERRPVAI
jgi:hypothetical protein